MASTIRITLQPPQLSTHRRPFPLPGPFFSRACASLSPLRPFPFDHGSMMTARGKRSLGYFSPSLASFEPSAHLLAPPERQRMVEHTLHPLRLSQPCCCPFC